MATLQDLINSVDVLQDSVTDLQTSVDVVTDVVNFRKSELDVAVDQTQASATSASLSETTATQQATLATTAKTDAETARLATETARDITIQAKDDAVAAKDITILAKDDAIIAKNDAETFKNETSVIRQDILDLLPNFPKPSVFALNKRGIAEGATFERKLKPVNNTVKLVEDLNPSVVFEPSVVKQDTLFSVLPENGTGDYVCSRNGTGTYFDKDGVIRIAELNQPRLDFDPVTGEFKGVLVEPSATNLFTYSDDLITGLGYFGGTTQTVIPNAIFGKDAVRITNETENNLNATNTARKDLNLGAGTYTISYWYKAINSTVLSLQTFGVGNNKLINGVNQTGITLPATDTFQKVNFTFTVTGDIGTVIIRLASNSTFIPTQVVEISMPQLEVGSVATSYIPTVASTVTRPADLIQKTNAQDLIGQSEGSVYFESYVVSNSLNARIYIALNLNVSDIFGIGIKDNKLTLVYRNNSGTLSTNTLGEVLQIGDKLKCCFIYTSNSLKVFVNGSLYSNTTTLLPSLSSISLTGDRLFYGTVKQHLKSATIFKTPLTDEQAIALTTL